jgi:drug/metabolite transporter (DMT)-like permease
MQLLVVSLVFALQLGLLYLGLSKTTASRGVLMINTQPFFVLFLAHWFIPGDQITKNKVLGLLLGFSGMALVFLGKKGVTAEVEIGDLVVLITAFLWACNTIYTKRIIHNFAPFQIVLYPMVFAVPFFFLAGYFWDVKMINHLDLEVLSSLLYQGLVTASFGFVAWNSMLKKYGAVSLHSFVFIMPIAGVLLGGLVLGEAITWDIILALACIVSGIVVVNLRTREYTPLYPPRGV